MDDIDLAAVAVLLREELSSVGLDPRRLRPSQLIQLLNSTPVGPVLTGPGLKRIRDLAGLRIGDGQSIDLLRFTAWLHHDLHPTAAERTAYEAHRERQQQRQAEQSRSSRDIGELPPVRNPRRRKRCGRRLALFCKTYFPKIFYLPFTRDHVRIIEKIEGAIRKGGMSAFAMPRGFGKTALTECACLWSVLYGYRPCAAIIGPDEDHAYQRIKNLRFHLESNDGLAEDFPEVCVPIRKLQGITQRRLLYTDKATGVSRPITMELSATAIVFPDIPDSLAAGSVIVATGITGQIRGMLFMRRDGTALRPSLAILDDPQTDESAKSPSQCDYREQVINGAVLGLAGPGVSITVLMPCTIIRQGDLADRMLDRSRNPEWHGERTRMVYAFPEAEDLWEQYAELRLQDLERDDRELTAATRFYRKKRKAMDAGAEVAWPERKYPHELSAVQHCMNLLYKHKERAFWAEFQNDPKPEDTDERLLTADQIAHRLNAMGRGEVPSVATHLTQFIDVQAKALWWVVVAWDDRFTGWIVDYGTEPEQTRSYFTLRDIRKSLASILPRAGLEAQIYAGLERLVGRTLGREWPAETGGVMRVERCLVDANWGDSTDVVYQFCRQSVFAPILRPSHGIGVTASVKPLNDYQRKPGDRVGHNWRIPGQGKLQAKRRGVRYVIYDTNYWKSFVHARLAVAMGDPCGISLFGRDPEVHRLLADHLVAERPVRTEGRGRVVDDWKNPQRLDNHWLDGLVGCAVAASMEGVSLPEIAGPPRKRKRVKFSELQAAKR